MYKRFEMIFIFNVFEIETEKFSGIGYLTLGALSSESPQILLKTISHLY